MNAASPLPLRSDKVLPLPCSSGESAHAALLFLIEQVDRVSGLINPESHAFYRLVAARRALEEARNTLRR